jgi:hypothetical protein
MNSTTDHIQHGKAPRRKHGTGPVYDILSAPALVDVEAILESGTGTNAERNDALRTAARSRTAMRNVKLDKLKVDAKTCRALTGNQNLLRGAKVTDTTFEDQLTNVNMDEMWGGGVAFLGGTTGLSANAANVWEFYSLSFDGASFTNAVFAGGRVGSMKRAKAHDALFYDVNIGTAEGAKLVETDMAFSSVGALDHAEVKFSVAPNMTGASQRYAILSDYAAAMSVKQGADMTAVAQIGDVDLRGPQEVTAQQAMRVAKARRPTIGLGLAA